MADRWEERNRGAMDRAGDEVRSWFGDDEAARRRRMDEITDERRDWSDGGYGRPLERGWNRSREAVRDFTDRDRDGRRGIAEWNDDDRPRHRLSERTAWGSSPAPFQSGRDTWNRERGYSGPASGTYGGTSPSGAGGPFMNAPDDAPGYWTHGTSYAGRGPKGYARGDERIREDICDRLTDDHRVDASDIDVQVSKGEVTLAGSVRSRDEKRSAEDVVDRVSGVREVNNHLKVRRSDEVIGTARSGASPLGLTDTPPPGKKA